MQITIRRIIEVMFISNFKGCVGRFCDDFSKQGKHAGNFLWKADQSRMGVNAWGKLEY